ncbi:MAG: hypothetical protein ACREFW_00565 [Rhizomicrobium sp.]
MSHALDLAVIGNGRTAALRDSQTRMVRWRLPRYRANFPQTYSTAGLILSAMRLCKSREERYWRASS